MAGMTYATFVCEPCLYEPGDDCSDERECNIERAERLPPIWENEDRPHCEWCGAELCIVAVLEPVAG